MLAILSAEAVLVDVDDGAQSEILMQIVEDLQLNCEVRQNNARTAFSVSATAMLRRARRVRTTACGLLADFKVGTKNSTQQLKVDGKERFVEWDCPHDEIEVIPKWLTPVKTAVKLFELEEGDGRNSALYGYILTLTGAGFTKDECRETLKIINQYVLKSPLSDDELAIIMRDDAFPKDTFFEKGAFLHDKFANYLKRNDRIVRINGMLHVYREGVYVAGAREIESMMIRHLPMLKFSHRVEVLKYLDIVCDNAEGR